MIAAGTATGVRVATWSRVAFAASMIACGVHAVATRDLVGIWGPVPPFIPGQAMLPWLVGVLLPACGIGLLWPRAVAIASRVVLAWLLLWLLLARLVEAAMAPGVEGYWSGCGETMVLAAAAGMLVARFDDAWARRHPRFALGDRGRLVARVVHGLALLPFGLAHFVYLKETISLVPAWLPFPRDWALFTGGAYLAASAALVSGVCARLAAVLAAWQIGALTALVWLPVVASGHANASQWSETVISLALTAAASVVAVSLRPESFRCDAPSPSFAPDE